MKLIKLSIIFLVLAIKSVNAYDDIDFNKWKLDLKKIALDNNISEKTFNLVMENVKYLPKVIEYDRFQPEFYEDTITYIKKRTSKQKQNNGIDFYKNNRDIIDLVEKEFDIEKELLLALMGIETNFGKYVGKMDIAFITCNFKL